MSVPDAARIALVTGATGGIGRATALRLHRHGWRVHAVGRNAAALAELAAAGLTTHAVDVTDTAAFGALVADLDAAHGAVDLLVACAGVGYASPMELVDLDALRRVFDVNVTAVLAGAQAVLPAMRRRGAGTVVVVGSTGGRFTSPGAGPYHLTKYALEAMAMALRAEVRPFGVRVVLLEPTGVRTGFIDAQHTAVVGAPGSAGGQVAGPYDEAVRRYARTTRALSRNRWVTIGPETVARAVQRAADARDPAPRRIVGLSGRLTVAARALLTDRLWDAVVSRPLRSGPPRP